MRARAAWTLDNLHQEAFIPAFMQALYDDSWDVRSAAGWGLVHLGLGSAGFVSDLLRSGPPEHVATMAKFVLERIGGAELVASHALGKADRNVRKEFRQIYLGGLAHDLMNAIAPIQGTVALLEESATPSQKPFLKMLKQSHTGLHTVYRQLLVGSRQLSDHGDAGK